MKWLLVVIFRDGPALVLRFATRDQAKCEADKLLTAGDQLAQLGPDADGSEAWAHPAHALAVAVQPDLGGGQIAVPRPAGQMRR